MVTCFALSKSGNADARICTNGRSRGEGKVKRSPLQSKSEERQHGATRTLSGPSNGSAGRSVLRFGTVIWRRLRTLVWIARDSASRFTQRLFTPSPASARSSPYTTLDRLLHKPRRFPTQPAPLTVALAQPPPLHYNLNIDTQLPIVNTSIQIPGTLPSPSLPLSAPKRWHSRRSVCS